MGDGPHVGQRRERDGEGVLVLRGDAQGLGLREAGPRGEHLLPHLGALGEDHLGAELLDVGARRRRRELEGGRHGAVHDVLVGLGEELGQRRELGARALHAGHPERHVLGALLLPHERGLAGVGVSVPERAGVIVELAGDPLEGVLRAERAAGGEGFMHALLRRLVPRPREEPFALGGADVARLAVAAPEEEDQGRRDRRGEEEQEGGARLRPRRRAMSATRKASIVGKRFSGFFASPRRTTRLSHMGTLRPLGGSAAS